MPASAWWLATLAPAGVPDRQEQAIPEALAALSRGAPEAMDRLMPLVDASSSPSTRAWLHEVLRDDIV